MASGVVVMLPLLRDNCRDSRYRGRINAAKAVKLLFEVAKHNAFYGYRCCSNGALAKQASDCSEHKATNAAKPVAPATRSAPALQFGGENCPVFLLVRAEL